MVDSAADTAAGEQQWAGQVITVLCEAAAAVTTAQADGRDHLDPQLLAELRRRYDEAVSWGQAQAVEACASTSSVNSSEGFFQL